MAVPILPDWFHTAYLSLPDLPRAVYTMSARQGLGHERIATRLGISTEQVSRHLAEALIHFERASREGG